MEKIPNRNDASRIVRKLTEAGHTAYLVGGFVRDMLRGVEPHDFDIATGATPDQVRKLFEHTIPVGISFGVVLVLIDGVPYEVATFRSDLAYTDGRHPDGVRFTSAEEDAARRDFTINGMFYDPEADRIIDFVDGQKDIERRIIRTIGAPEDRFQEDKLRMLRAVRFSGALEYGIEQETSDAIIKHAPEIAIVSAERIREELTKILTCPHPRKGVELADELGLLIHILPELETMKGVEQPPEFHPEGDVWNHTMLALDYMPPAPDIELAMAALLHDVGKPSTFTVEDRIRFNRHVDVGAKMAGKIMRRLRFSKRQQDIVVELVRNHLKFMHVHEMRTAKLKRFLRMERFDLHMELHRMDCMASHQKLNNYEFCLEKIEEFGKQKEILRPPRLITGKDLIDMGLKPGPEFSIILKELEDAQLEGSITTRQAALDHIRNNYLKSL